MSRRESVAGASRTLQLVVGAEVEDERDGLPLCLQRVRGSRPAPPGRLASAVLPRPVRASSDFTRSRSPPSSVATSSRCGRPRRRLRILDVQRADRRRVRRRDGRFARAGRLAGPPAAGALSTPDATRRPACRPWPHREKPEGLRPGGDARRRSRRAPPAARKRVRPRPKPWAVLSNRNRSPDLERDQGPSRRKRLAGGDVRDLSGGEASMRLMAKASVPPRHVRGEVELLAVGLRTRATEALDGADLAAAARA